MSYFDFPFRYVDLNPTVKKTDYSKYYANLPPGVEPLSWNPEWSIMGILGSIAHFEEMLHSMANLKSVEEIRNHPFPDFFEDYRWERILEKISSLKVNDLITVAFIQMTIFEIAWYLRGMNNFIIDMLTNQEYTNALLDAITEIRIGVAERYAKAGIDIIKLGDDVSTQLDMMISPDLIEIGIDILNPIQPECMDPFMIKKLYGDRLSLWGTLGNQTTLPFSTPEEIKETYRKLIEVVGEGGGLLLAPIHMVEPDVQWENVEAFIEAIKEYGLYI